MSISQIARSIKASPTLALNEKAAILRDKGILSSRKDANKVFYRVDDERTLRLIGMMQELFCSSR